MIKMRILFFLLVVLCGAGPQSIGQNINWGSLQKEQKHLATISAGWDYGLVAGAGYGYQLNSGWPALITVHCSFPSGKKAVDDFKIKMGGQVRLYKIRHFQFSTSVQGLYRRYENPLARMQNLGAELSVTAGYYKPKWFVAGKFGFDKAMFTHLKHTDIFQENIYAEVRDGWYSASGGNFRYGIQAGYSFRQHDLTVEIGKAVSQDFKTTPLIPYYLQVGYNFKIREGLKNRYQIQDAR